MQDFLRFKIPFLTEGFKTCMENKSNLANDLDSSKQFSLILMTFCFLTVTFEDKRKDNFEKGRLELERRRMELQEKMKKERDERERKEALEEERRQRAKLEAEQKRQAELEKQRQQQLEMEREQEALRKKMIQQRLVRHSLHVFFS